MRWNYWEYFSVQRFPDVKSIVRLFSGVIGESLTDSSTAGVFVCNKLFLGAGETVFFPLVGSSIVLKVNTNMNNND